MSLMAPIVDGKLVTDNSQNTSNKTDKNARGNGSLDKDAFLQLLVAQMKYQDPMEPTSNTEYVSQYATFSELEEMQNMSSSLDLSRASELVGKTVIVSTTTSDGKTTEISGVIDYVTYEANKAYVSIGGTLYSADNIKEVLNSDYVDGMEIIKKMKEIMKKLPAIENVTMNDATNVVDLYNYYSSLTTYQKSFLDKTTDELIGKYVSRISELIDTAGDEAGENKGDKGEEKTV